MGKIIITGGAGFIGYNLGLYYNKKGIHPILIDNLHPFCGGNNFHISRVKGEWIIKDMKDVEWQEILEDGDIVYDLAGQTSHGLSMKKPREDLNNNVLGHISLMEGIRDSGKDVKVVYTSTRQVYGKAKYLPVDEKHPVKPMDINGVNKWMSEEYYSLFHRLYGIEVIILRLTNVYGYGQHIRTPNLGFTGWFINRVITNNPIELIGGGKNLRDFLFIDDAIEAIVRSSEIKDYDVFNIGGYESKTIKEFASLLKELYGVEVIVREWKENEKIIDIGDYTTNDYKFREAANWKPSVSLKEGIEKTVVYYKEYGEYYLD